jgi:hypothetical protein
MALFRETGTRDHLYLEAAGGVIAQYLNTPVFAEDADSFWGARKVNEQGDLWYGYPLRVILIGETLFLLRNTRGFEEMCRRLKTRALRPPYYEMLAAKTFFRAGFDIDMRPETGNLGSDFDFAAIRKGLTINVEVTALQEKEFYERTAINALHTKRRQLPKDKPAIIFCVLPEQWEKIGMDLNAWSANVANEFFLSGIRRINRLVFYLERHIDIGSQTTGGFINVSNTFDNPNPYFPCNFDHIFKGGRSDMGQLLMEDALENPESLDTMIKRVRTGEFFEWVDSFHDD